MALVGTVAIVGVIALAAASAWGQGATVAYLEAAIAAAGPPPREATGSAPSVWDVNLPLARLKLKKARMLEAGGGGMFVIARPEEAIAEGMEAMAMFERGEVYQPPPGELTELAYITRNDETVQPFYVHIPDNYDPARPWPLIVFLHGYVPSITMVDPWLLSDEVCDIAERNGCLLVLPYARRNTDFQGVGEVDVFRVIEEMRRRFNVDPARIHLSGVSMGGMGTWTIGLRNPGFFASLAPISGQTDMFRWWGWDPERMTPFKRFLVEWDNAEEMALNARGQKIFLQHGELDHLIPVIESRSMVALLGSLGLPIEYYEYAGASHYIYWETECYERAWGWCRDLVVDPSPPEVNFRCFSLNYNRAFWLTIDRLEHWGTAAHVTARVQDDGSALAIDCDNVAALTIALDDCPLQPGAESYRVSINGEERTLPPDEGRLRIVIDPLEPTAEWPPLKRKGLCGPAEDVFNSRFIVVQGTAGDDAQDMTIAAQVGEWAEEWDGFADGEPIVRTDEALLNAQIATANLVLFGTPETNSVLARIADRLPVEIGDHCYEVLGRRFEGPELGLVLCYPNPLAPDHYVLIYAGELYGRHLSINHKHDMLPDFLIFDSTMLTVGDTEANVFGGWFDVDWQPRPELAWEGAVDAEPAARAVPGW